MTSFPSPWTLAKLTRWERFRRLHQAGRPSSQKSSLTSRLITGYTAAFPKGFRNDVQIIANVLSVDTGIPGCIRNDRLVIALSISDNPLWAPPERWSWVLSTAVCDKSCSDMERSRLDLTVSGTRDAVMMVEAGATEVTEAEMLEAILRGHDEIKRIVAFQNEIVAAVGVPKKEYPLFLPSEEIEAAVREYAYDRVVWSLDTFDRTERQQRQDQVSGEVVEHLIERFPEGKGEIADALYNLTKEIVRAKILRDGVRPDGRALNEIRPIWSEVGILHRKNS